MKSLNIKVYIFRHENYILTMNTAKTYKIGLTAKKAYYVIISKTYMKFLGWNKGDRLKVKSANRDMKTIVFEKVNGE